MVYLHRFRVFKADESPIFLDSAYDLLNMMIDLEIIGQLRRL